MGKTVKKVLKVAAFVAIATFAAPIAAGIGLSTAVGTIAGSALVGAAMGAATNGILGGSVLKGALMGGLAGGAGGLSKVLSTPGTPLLGDAAATAAAPASALPAGAVDTSIAGAATGGTAPGIGAGTGEIVVNAPTAGIGAAAPGLAGGGAGLSAGAPTVAGQGPGSNMTGDITNNAIAAGVTPAVAPAATAAAAPVTAAPAQAGLLSNIGNRALNTAKAIAPQLIASGLAGGAQGDLAAQQQKMLEDQQRQYNDNFNLKTQYAQGLIDDANQFNAETGGRRAAESARIRAGLSASNAARLSDPRRAEAIRRQGAIEGGRNATTEYWNAYGANAAARTNTRAAGINAIPLGQQPSSSSYDSAYGRAGANEAGTAALINRGLAVWDGRNTGDKDDPNTPQDERYYA